jgi:hypothetical protein
MDGVVRSAGNDCLINATTGDTIGAEGASEQTR